MFITTSLCNDVTIIIATTIVVSYFYIRHKYSYWNKRGVPQLSPVFPFGDYFKGLPKGISLGAYSKTFYDRFKKGNHKLGGVYLGLDPYLVVVDAGYVKNVLIQDFQYFVGRGLYHNAKNPITVSLLTQEGAEWKNTRAKFTNIFTSVKMKYFFNTIKKCSDELNKNLEYFTKNQQPVDIYEMMGCYTTDVIGSVVMGIEANSFKQPDAIFRKLGRELFGEFSLIDRLALFMTICYPDIAKKIGISNIQQHIEDFFKEFVIEALEYRQKNNAHGTDFLELLIEMKESGINLTNQEIMAQVFLFFSAGFETSSASASFALFELGLNKEIQKRVRDEINSVLETHNGEITYEALQEMSYLTQVFYETARKYPLLTTINRVCAKDYKFQDTDFVVRKGTRIILPVLGYHCNPSTFPDPLRWDPSRFDDKNVKYDGFLPFGDGPRNCIGSRFGLMQVKLGLVQILKDYDVSVSQETKAPLKLDEKTFVTRPIETIYLTLKKITPDI